MQAVQVVLLVFPTLPHQLEALVLYEHHYSARHQQQR
jgi:hypothetical protein